VLTLTALSKRYRAGNYGVREVSLEVGSGVLGLLGPNGAGKTTLMQMVATVTRPTTGEIRFRGVDVLARPDELRRRLGYLPQDFGVYEELTAWEHLSYFAALKGVGDRRRIEEMLELVNLHGVARRPVGGFSGGMKQRLGIAQALVNEPDLLIVDEPTVGLDPEERLRFRTLLSELGSGRLVILSTHIVPDVESIATHIAVLAEGSLVTCESPESLVETARGQVWEATVSDAEYEKLRALPGIGDYTAAAIAAIAYDAPVVPVDGNISRVVARLFAIDAPLPRAKPEIRDAAARLLPKARAGDFAQALMDLGATICTPKSPACLHCPLRGHCLAQARGTPENFPVKEAKRQGRLRRGAAFVVRRADGALLMRTRPAKGLLGGMTEVPTTVWTHDFDAAHALRAAPHFAGTRWRLLPGTVRHVFTHFPLKLTIFIAHVPRATKAR